MSIREPIGANTRRCETTVVAVDGGCVTCGVGPGQACALKIPEHRRAAMSRRQRLAQTDRLKSEAEANAIAAWGDASWWS